MVDKEATIDEVQLIVPPEAEFHLGKGLFLGSKYIANFEPKVEQLVDSMNDGVAETLVYYKLVFADGSESEIRALLLSELDAVNWHDIDLRCRINPGFSGASKHIASFMRADFSEIIRETEQILDRTGGHDIDGTAVFYDGSELIAPIGIGSKSKIKLIETTQKMVVDPNCSERQAIDGIMRIVSLSPSAIWIILMHCLLAIMRPVYAEVYKVPRFILFLVGLTGTKKTTIAAFLTQMCNRDKGILSPLRLRSSSPAFEQILYDAVDCAVVLDDLFPAESSETKRDQEKTFNDLLRAVGDDSGRAIKQGNEVVTKTPRCNVMTTGEYLVGTGSDAARMLPIMFPRPIDTAKLTECQSEPLIVSTFYRYFIVWYITNYQRIRDLLTELLAESRMVHMGVHGRLQERLGVVPKLQINHPAN